MESGNSLANLKTLGLKTLERRRIVNKSDFKERTVRKNSHPY